MDSIPVKNPEAGAGERLKPLSEFYTTGTPLATPTLAAILTAGNAAGSKKITGLTDGTDAQDAATVAQLPATATLAAVLTAGADAGTKAITGLLDPTNAQDAATRAFVLANASAPPAYEEWPATQENFSVTAQDRDVNVVCLKTPGQGSNNETFTLPTSPATGRRIRLYILNNAGPLDNTAHLNFAGSGATIKKNVTTTTVTNFLSGGSLASIDQWCFELVCVAANTWRAFTITRPIAADGANSRTGDWAA